MPFFAFAISILSMTAGHAGARQAPPGHPWVCYGGGVQHQGNSPISAAPLHRILWSASLDDWRTYYDSTVPIHYSSPVITPNNTVIHSFNFTKTVNGDKVHNNWRVVARNGKTGGSLWTYTTDYANPNTDWTPVYPLCLTGNNQVAYAGSGGTVYFRADADAPSSTVTRVCFYSKLADYSANPASFSNIKICTPLTGDASGNVWFGYRVDGTTPDSVSAALGTGGVAKVSASGKVAFKAAVDGGLSDAPAYNASPALSLNGSSVYVAVGTGWGGQLLKLNTSNLAVEASVDLMDPYRNSAAYIAPESSAAPMVGPDGHVFFGVLDQTFLRGWMLQFDGNLSQLDSKGKTFPVGAFGWDSTASMVPTSIVHSYKGAAPYLILTKYNTYVNQTGNGANKIAVLDPTANDKSTQVDNGFPVMNEIMTVDGPTLEHLDSDPAAVYEWCINSAVIDVKGKAAILNSEDGHCYRWDLVNNKLVEGVKLQPATGEAYTCTVIGPDGTAYAINNSIMFAVAGAPAFTLTSVHLFQGTAATGTTQSLLQTDGSFYSVDSQQTTNGYQSAGVQATFTAPFAANKVKSPLYLNVSGYGSLASTTLQIFAKNVQTNAFDQIQSVPFMNSPNVSLQIPDVAKYMTSNGVVTIVVRALASQGRPAFTAKFDQVLVSADSSQN